MKNYTLPAIGFGLLALIYGLYSTRPSSEPIATPLAANLPVVTQTQALIQPAPVEPDSDAISSLQSVVSVPVIQAAAVATSTDQPATPLSGYDKLCNRLADNASKMFLPDICTWRQQLRNEVSDEPWASETEATITDCVENLLLNNPSLTRPQRIECHRSGCEVHSLVAAETRNSVFTSRATMCKSEAFTQTLTAKGNGCTTSGGQYECISFFARRGYVPDIEIDSEPMEPVLNPVQIAEGFENILRPQPVGGALSSTQNARLHTLLESESRDEAWATLTEQQIRRYVDVYLAQQGVERDALVLHVVVCGQTLCEMQVSSSKEVVRNSALNWQTVSRQMMKDAFTGQFSENRTLVTTLSNGNAGFVSFYQRRK